MKVFMWKLVKHKVPPLHSLVIDPKGGSIDKKDNLSNTPLCQYR